MSAVTPLPETEWIRMGALVVRTDVNHRKHRNMERIKEYVRMLESGLKPPPIKVHRVTNVVVNGLHRFFAAKAFSHSTGQKWMDTLIEVEWTDEIPNPEAEPLLFAVQSATENRFNGEPLDRADVIRLLAQIIDKYGKETARACALQMNETSSSFEEIYRSLTPATPPPDITTRQAQGTDTPAMVTGEDVAAASDTGPTRPATDIMSPRLPSNNVSELRSTRPPIISACRNLRQSIEQAKGDFTDAERSEMEHAYEVLRVKLNK